MALLASEFRGAGGQSGLNAPIIPAASGQRPESCRGFERLCDSISFPLQDLQASPAKNEPLARNTRVTLTEATFRTR